MDIISFLYARKQDGREFEFEYINKDGRSSKPRAIAVNYIDKSSGKVKIYLGGDQAYTYVMRNMKIINAQMFEAVTLEKTGAEFNTKVDNFLFKKEKSIYDYFSTIVEKLIEKNENSSQNPEGLNYSLKMTKKNILSVDQRKYNRECVQKYMEGRGARKISEKEPKFLFPFSSNISQKEAMGNAFCYDISTIQGPPGTGKTQTILNIICNAILNKKRVLVVSNNNSAIDNVLEKLENQSDLLRFSVRLGSRDCYISKLMETVGVKITYDFNQAVPLSEKKRLFKEKRKDLIHLDEEINRNEAILEKLILEENLLNDLKNQKRHIDRKIKTYLNEKTEVNIQKFSILPSQLKVELAYLRKKRVQPESLLMKAYFNLRFFTRKIDVEKYTMYQWRLEQLYAIKMIRYLEKRVQRIPTLRHRLKEDYEIYQKESIYQVNQSIQKWLQDRKPFAEKIMKALSAPDCEFRDIKSNLLKCYPVVLTTLDSVVSNIGNEKYDLVIIDEASQSNIIAGLPALNSAKQVVIVGDAKQLSHIVDKEMKIYDKNYRKQLYIKDDYSFSDQNLLTSITSICQPPEVLLKEHYRCDFNIINYCNRKFYDNKLVIYSREASKDSLKIMALNKERNSAQGKRKNGQNSFYNKLEEREIINFLQENSDSTSIITPYAKQEENLIEILPELKDKIGTIYKFQGRENKRVLISTVLTKECKQLGERNPLGHETINVAVSRAQEELVLFTHDTFFKDNKHELKDLIEYIETYGTKLTSTVHSIFSYLYKELPYYKSSKDYDSLWEEKLHEVMGKCLEEYDGFSVQMKLPLSDIAGDRDFLNNNPELMKFAMHKNAHVDFAIIHELTNKTILAIELDGESHDKDIQKERDRKKSTILDHHKIPLWRISSKEALTQEDVKYKLEKHILLSHFDDEINVFFKENSWKL